MSRAARIAALCVSTMGPCDRTFFNAWSTYAATSRVYSGGRSDRTVYSSPPIITLTACFLVLTQAPPALPALVPPPVPPPFPPHRPACPPPKRHRHHRARTRPSTLSPSYAKLVLQRLQRSCQQLVHFALSQRPGWVPEGAVPRHAAISRRHPGAAILVEHFESLEQRSRRASQHGRHGPGTHTRRQEQRDVPFHRRLCRQRAIVHRAGQRRIQSHLEPEQRRRPDRGVGFEPAGPAPHLPPLHRLPTDHPTRCRLHVA